MTSYFAAENSFLRGQDDIDLIRKTVGEQKYQALLNYLIVNTYTDLTWTNIRLPEEVKPGYLISNNGLCINYFYRGVRLAGAKYIASRKKFSLSLQKFAAKRSGSLGMVNKRDYVAQKLFLLNFCEIPSEVITELDKYYCLHIDNDRTSYDLEDLYLVKTGICKSGFTLRDVFELREVLSVINPETGFREMSYEKAGEIFGMEPAMARGIHMEDKYQILLGDKRPKPYTSLDQASSCVLLTH